MMTLYGVGPSRWVKPYWTLRELNIDFKEVDAFSETSALKLINPLGKAPVLVDGDFVLSESNSIVTYLADKYPDSCLAPKAGTIERALYQRCLDFCLGDLEQPLWRILRHARFYDEKDRSESDIALARFEFIKLAEVVETEIGTYIVGNRFSGADIVLTYTLNWATWFGLLDKFPKLRKYIDTHKSRPNFPNHLYDNIPV